MADSFFRISNENEFNSIFDGTEVKTLDKSLGDSIHVKINIEGHVDRAFDLYLVNYLQSQKYRKKWSPDGLDFHIGPEGKGLITLWIIPEINPFERYDSWGDSQTASRILNPIFEVDVRFNDLEITIPNSILDYLSKWYVDNEYVVKLEDRILWRNYEFIKLR